MLKCKICGSSDGDVRTVAERMFDMRGAFDYYDCTSCGCLQIIEVPANLSDYYPGDAYHAYARQPSISAPSGSSVRQWLMRRRNKYALFGKPAIYAPLAAAYPSPGVGEFRKYLRGSSNQSTDCRILDVGCASGCLLDDFATLGFTRLLGVDPFIPRETLSRNGVELVKSDLRDLTGRGSFDVIIFDHVFEHVVDQVDTLCTAASLLASGGIIHIEVPVAGCQAWVDYGPDWIEWDAPRHLYLHTQKSMTLVADSAGLEVAEAHQAGTVFEFCGSEMYRRGIPYFDPETKAMRNPATMFSDNEMQEFASRCAKANAAGLGGRISFVLRPTS